jgi:5-(carboxyamino)imidazole ribonucleotide synthase
MESRAHDLSRSTDAARTNGFSECSAHGDGMTPILPGATLGILGGGQLGRMFAIAARRMGYRIHCLDPIVYGPTGQIADLEINAAYDDVDAAREFARGVDVVSFEFENIPAETLAAIESICPVRPGPFILDTTRHRLREKRWLSGHGFPVAPFEAIRSIDDLKSTLDRFDRAILKTAEFGYDGKGQWRLDRKSESVSGTIMEIARQLDGVQERHVLEKMIDFDYECSVVTARWLDGRVQSFVPFVNEHRSGILDITTAGLLDERLASRATRLAEEIATQLNLVGVLCCEMFVCGHDLLINELAPRPHNSGHLTFDGAITSQFEQQVRAVCNLPPGDPTLTGHWAMANLLGDLWFDRSTGKSREPDWAFCLSGDSAVKLHLYGKSEARPGRKMGHLSVIGASPADARARAIAARERLTR